MRDWEGMEWEQFEAVCRQMMQGMADDTVEGVRRCMGRHDEGVVRGLVVDGVCGKLRGGHFRESGLWSKSWEQEMEDCGVQ